MDTSDVPVLKADIDRNQVELAVKALFANAQKSAESKKKLFKEKDIFSLTLSYKKVPPPSLKPFLIPLSHPINKDVDVCLFSALPGKEAKSLLEEKGVTGITKVISMDKLKKNYKTFANRRELCSAYDLFLCDNKLFNLMPKYLGKAFYGRKKQPLPVNFKRDIKHEIERALSATRMMVGNGPCCNVKVGTTEQTEEEIIENILDVTNFMAENLPGGWINLKSLHLKTSRSISLPIYNSLPEYEGKSDEDEDEIKEKTPKGKEKEKKRRKRPLLEPTSTEDGKDNSEDVGNEIKKAKFKKKRTKSTKPILKKIGVR